MQQRKVQNTGPAMAQQLKPKTEWDDFRAENFSFKSDLDSANTIDSELEDLVAGVLAKVARRTELPEGARPVQTESGQIFSAWASLEVINAALHETPLRDNVAQLGLMAKELSRRGIGTYLTEVDPEIITLATPRADSLSKQGGAYAPGKSLLEELVNPGRPEEATADRELTLVGS